MRVRPTQHEEQEQQRGVDDHERGHGAHDPSLELWRRQEGELVCFATEE